MLNPKIIVLAWLLCTSSSLLRAQSLQALSTDSLIELQYHIFYSDLDSSLVIGDELIRRYQKGDDEAGILGYNLLGYTYFYRDKYDKAREAFHRSNEIIEKSGILPSYQVDNYNLLASIAANQGDYPLAVEYLGSAESHISEEMDWYDRVYFYHGIAHIFYDLEDHESAWKYVEDCNELFEAHQDEAPESRSPCNPMMADMLQRQGKLDEAEKLARIELEKGTEENQLISIIYAYEILAAIAWQRDMRDSAIALQKASLEVARKMGDKFSSTIAASLLGKYHLQNDNLAAAGKMAAVAHELGGDLPPNLAKKQLLQLQHRLAAALGDHESALEHFSELAAINLAMARAGISKELLESKYDLSKKENALLELETRFQQQKLQSNNRWMYIFAGGFSVFLILLIFSVVSHFKIRRINRKLKRSEHTLQSQRQELKNLNAELVKTNSNKDKLLSILSHDVRQPFNQTLSLLAILDSYPLPEDFPADLISNMMHSVEENKQSVENLLTWSKNQLTRIHTKPAQLKLLPLLQAVKSSLEHAISQKNLQLKLEVDPHQEVFADPGQLEIILRNLLVNAIKFSHPDTQIVLSAMAIGKEVKIIVQDSGVGMSKDKVDSLFDENSQLSERGTLNETGSGLGMLIVSDFVKENEGRIEVESEQGKGSAFSVYLPVTASVAPAAANGSDTRPEASHISSRQPSRLL